MILNIQSKYQRISDVPNEIALFPLDEVILLPRASLPLNIFEPRYLKMVEDAMSSNRVIGIVQPADSNKDNREPAQLRQIGCAGRITEYSETEGDRLIINLTGIIRFKITQELKTKGPYRMAQVNYANFEDDLLPGLGQSTIDRAHFLDVLKAYLSANDLEADWESIHEASNENLVNTLSIISPYGSEEKQALLEAGTIKNRADVLVALAEMELALHHSDGPPGRLQ